MNPRAARWGCLLSAVCWILLIALCVTVWRSVG